MVAIEILERLYFAISKGPVTFNELCRRSRIHPKTVRSYIKVIEHIQSQRRIAARRVGFKVVVQFTDERHPDALKTLPCFSPKANSDRT